MKTKRILFIILILSLVMLNGVLAEEIVEDSYSCSAQKCEYTFDDDYNTYALGFTDGTSLSNLNYSVSSPLELYLSLLYDNSYPEECTILLDNLLVVNCFDFNAKTLVEVSVIGSPFGYNFKSLQLPVGCYNNSPNIYIEIDEASSNFCFDDEFNGYSILTKIYEIELHTSEQSVPNITFPNLTEVCNGIDDDLDGWIDEDDSCTAEEVCNGIDDDYNGVIDDVDIDNDGLNDCIDDKCLNTNVLNPNIGAYSLADTFGCSCEQILEYKPGKNVGELKSGCSRGTIENWISEFGWS